MQKDSHLFDDLARVAGGAMSSFATFREETEARLKAQFERILASMDLVRRDEFEAVQAMAVKARKENQALAKRLDALEGKGAAKTGTRATSAKAPSRSTKPKAAAKKAAAPAKTKASSSRRKGTTAARSAKSSSASRRKS